jgi:hypothetical protein
MKALQNNEHSKIKKNQVKRSGKVVRVRRDGTDLHLINSVGQARKETATPAPAPATTFWLTVSGAPG